MDDRYKEYIPTSGEDTIQQNARLRAQDVEILELIAEAEGDKRILSLMYEGVGRVIESRLLDPEWMANATSTLREQAQAYTRRVEELEPGTERSEAHQLA